MLRTSHAGRALPVAPGSFQLQCPRLRHDLASKLLQKAIPNRRLVPIRAPAMKHASGAATKGKRANGEAGKREGGRTQKQLPAAVRNDILTREQLNWMSTSLMWMQMRDSSRPCQGVLRATDAVRVLMRLSASRRDVGAILRGRARRQRRSLQDWRSPGGRLAEASPDERGPEHQTSTKTSQNLLALPFPVRFVPNQPLPREASFPFV